MLYVIGNVATAVEDTPAVYRAKAHGYASRRLLGKQTSTTHIGWSLAELEGGGELPAHLHAYEETFFILEGTPIVTFEGQAYQLGLGDYGVFPLGTPHAWRNEASAAVRWLEVQAPARYDESADTILLREAAAPVSARQPNFASPLTRFVGHSDQSLFLPLATPDSRRRSRLYRQGLAGELVGAHFSHTVMIQLHSGGFVALHDHPHEEAYFMLDGEVEITLADETRLLKAGDYGWAGIGTHHTFRNLGSAPARWVETQSPMPSQQHFTRILHEWREARQAEMGDQS